MTTLGNNSSSNNDNSELPMVGFVKPAKSKANNKYYKVHLSLAQVNGAIKANKGTWTTDDGKDMISLVAFATKAKNGLVIRPQSF